MRKINIFASAILLFSLCFIHSQCRAAEITEDLPEGEMVTIAGKIISLKMTAFSGNPWEELALADESGKIYILIGKEVEKLQDKQGARARITWITKPAMIVSGKTTTVVEISEFSLINPVQESKEQSQR